MESEPDYSDVLRRLGLSLVLATNEVEVERNRARVAWDDHLSALEPGPRLMAIRSNPDLQTWGTFDLLLAEAKRITLERPVEAVDLAYAALAVTDLLDPHIYGEEPIHDFRASAWAALGNAKRMTGDFPGAEEAVQTAAEVLEQGTGDPYEEANVLSITASLLTDLGDLETAVDRLEDAAKLSRSVRDRFLESRVRIQQSSAIGWIDPARGLKLAERALRALRKSRNDDKRLELGGVYLTAFWANELGDFEEARATLETYRYLYAAFPDSWPQGRLLLLDALICRNEGRLEESERLLHRLVEHYTAQGMAFDLTLATLEWAEALVLLGRHREATGVLQEVYPLIEQWGAHVDILRAWKIVEEAVRRQAVHHQTFRELAMTVRRRWGRTGVGPTSRSSALPPPGVRSRDRQGFKPLGVWKSLCGVGCGKHRAVPPEEFPTSLLTSSAMRPILQPSTPWRGRILRDLQRDPERSLMPKESATQGETMHELQNLAATMAAYIQEIPHLEAPHAKLVGLLGEMTPLIALQADLAAQRQETSKKLRGLLNEASRLGTFLRVGLKQHYGPRSEKLTTFKMQPFRGRKAAAKPEEPVFSPRPTPTSPDPKIP